MADLKIHKYELMDYKTSLANHTNRLTYLTQNIRDKFNAMTSWNDNISSMITEDLNDHIAIVNRLISAMDGADKDLDKILSELDNYFNSVD